jgi:cell division protein FtsA
MATPRPDIITGIDVGTHQVKVVVVRAPQSKKERGMPQLIGTGHAESRGLRNGYIINETDVIRSIKTAVAQAEKHAGVSIKKAYVSIGSIGLDEVTSTGEIIPARADSEITDVDVEKVTTDSEERIVEHIPNRRILHGIPLRYRVDGELVLGKPHGMRGTKLEVDSLFITAFEQHLNELTKAIEASGIQVEDVMAAPLATSFVLLTKAQKRAGCVLANLGAETVSIAVFEDFLPISVKIFPIGSNEITNDLALGLRISIEEAEKAKRGGMTSTTVPKKKIDEIMSARLTDIFELIDNHLKKLKKDALLPAGVVLTGGGSNLTMTQEVARNTLNLPARFAHLEINKNTKTKDASWSVAYGLCMLGASSQDERSDIGITKQSKRSLLDWFSQFLP